MVYCRNDKKSTERRSILIIIIVEVFVSSAATDRAEEDGRHAMWVKSKLSPFCCSGICITMYGRLHTGKDTYYYYVRV